MINLRILLLCLSIFAGCGLYAKGQEEMAIATRCEPDQECIINLDHMALFELPASEGIWFSMHPFQVPGQEPLLMISGPTSPYPSDSTQVYLYKGIHRGKINFGFWNEHTNETLKFPVTVR